MTRNVVLGQAAQRAATQPSSLSDFVLSSGHFLPDLVHGLPTGIEQPLVQQGRAGVVQRVVPLDVSNEQCAHDEQLACRRSFVPWTSSLP